MKQVVKDKVPEVVYFDLQHDIFHLEKSNTKMRVVF